MTKPKDSQAGSKGQTAGSAPGAAAHEFISQVQQFWAPYSASFQEQRQQFERGLDEFSKAHDQGMTHARETTEEMSELVKASVDYSQKLGQQWVNLGLDATRRMLGQVAPSA